MLEEIEVRLGLTLEDYAQTALLAQPVAELSSEAKLAAKRLSGTTIWMVNSAARGGGVAEMLPKQVSLLRQLGVDVRWLVLGSERPEFFELTKRLHNLIHSTGDPALGARERELYDAVSQKLALELQPLMKPQDIVIAHDPQPAGMAAALKRLLDIKVVWRCHIGLETETEATQSAWAFLKPYLEQLDHSVFSSPAYVPEFLSHNASIIVPAIDPLTHKNRELHPVKLAGVLSNGGLLLPDQPVVTPPFNKLVERLSSNGRFRSLDGAPDIGLMFRPTVTQVSRWDRLKGWEPLLKGFVRLKQELKAKKAGLEERSRRRLELVRLILGGPEPASVQDDPEAGEVLRELVQQYQRLSPTLQRDIAIVSLPMHSTKENALIVNALQRCSSVVVQNSLQEGFGLVVTEAMWKRTPVLGSKAYGIRQQIRDGIDGLLIDDPTDPEVVKDGLVSILGDPHQRATWACSAQRRVYDEFLIFHQLCSWLRLLVKISEEKQSPT